MIKQGPNAGRVLPAERVTIDDPISGLPVTRLTSYHGHHWQPYFTDNTLWDDGRQQLVSGERDNQLNLFSIHLETGAITQLTDLGITPELATVPRHFEASLTFHQGNRHPLLERWYFRFRNAIWSVDLRSGELAHLWDAPAGQTPGKMSVTADGRYLCTSTRIKLRDCWPDWCDGYHSWLHRIDTATGKGDVVHEDDNFIGHVNTSPTLPEIVTFCHEGAPWRLVSRIWGANVATGEVWPIRPLTEKEGVNHEWWFADGEYLGFMASRGERYRDTCIGRIRYDNTERVEWPSGPHCTHYYGNTTDLIVGDGTREEPYLFAWSLRDGEWLGPRVVCRHGTTFCRQVVHAHARLAPDDSFAVYASDLSNYAQVYRVDLTKSFDDLPAWPLPEQR